MAEDLRLPPHIENISGCYFNRLNNRWVGNYKIQKICDDYWANNEYSSTQVTPSGTTFFKKNVPVKPKEKRRTKFKKDNELIEAIQEVDYGIVASPVSEKEQIASNDIFVDSAKTLQMELLNDPIFQPPKVNIHNLVKISTYASQNRVTASYIYQLANNGKIEIVEIDDKKFINIEKYPSVQTRWDENHVKEVDARLEKENAEFDAGIKLKRRGRVSGKKYTKKPQEIDDKLEQMADIKPITEQTNPHEIHIDMEADKINGEKLDEKAPDEKDTGRFSNSLYDTLAELEIELQTQLDAVRTLLKYHRQ